MDARPGERRGPERKQGHRESKTFARSKILEVRIAEKKKEREGVEEPSCIRAEQWVKKAGTVEGKGTG